MGTICHKWWQRNIVLDAGQARACRAHLRRARHPVEALEVEASHELNYELTEIGKSLQRQPERLAVIVISLAHIRATDKDPVASRFGRIKQEGQSRTLNKIRFTALLRANEQELIVRLPRALSLIDHRANVARLANDLFYWGDLVHTRWCYEYYGHRGALPSTSTLPT